MVSCSCYGAKEEGEGQKNYTGHFFMIITTCISVSHHLLCTELNYPSELVESL